MFCLCCSVSSCAAGARRSRTNQCMIGGKCYTIITCFFEALNVNESVLLHCSRLWVSYAYWCVLERLGAITVLMALAWLRVYLVVQPRKCVVTLCGASLSHRSCVSDMSLSDVLKRLRLCYVICYWIPSRLRQCWVSSGRFFRSWSLTVTAINSMRRINGELPQTISTMLCECLQDSWVSEMSDHSCFGSETATHLHTHQQPRHYCFTKGQRFFTIF